AVLLYSKGIWIWQPGEPRTGGTEWSDLCLRGVAGREVRSTLRLLHRTQARLCDHVAISAGRSTRQLRPGSDRYYGRDRNRDVLYLADARSARQRRRNSRGPAAHDWHL